MSRGRPSIYEPKLAEKICELLASDKSLVSICQQDGMPTTRTVHRWRKENEEFCHDYARAREEQGHAAADTVGEIRRKILTGAIDPNVGKAAADLAKWEASKRAARDFGDKLDVTTGGEAMQNMDETAIAVRIASLLQMGLDRDGSD